LGEKGFEPRGKKPAKDWGEKGGTVQRIGGNGADTLRSGKRFKISSESKGRMKRIAAQEQIRPVLGERKNYPVILCQSKWELRERGGRNAVMEKLLGFNFQKRL